jgi:hypothetical protein
MRSNSLISYVAAALFAACVFASGLAAAPLYTATKNSPMFKATTSTDGNTNCQASEGCLGKQYAGGGGFFFVVDDIDNGIDDGLLPDKLNYVFTLTNAQKDAIRNNDGIGKITVTAARDIGRLLNPAAADGYDPGTEFINVEVSGVAVAGVNLFKETKSNTSTTPPHTENNVDLTKGPNFNTDVLATDSGVISKLMMQEAADNNQIEIALDPTDKVARLKIKSITLEYNAVPEPAAAILMILAGMAVIGRGRWR